MNTKSTEIQFERREKGGDTWEPISKEKVLEVFSRNFIDTEIALQVLIDLGSTQTAFFDYRVKKEINDDQRKKSDYADCGTPR